MSKSKWPKVAPALTEWYRESYKRGHERGNELIEKGVDFNTEGKIALSGGRSKVIYDEWRNELPCAIGRKPSISHYANAMSRVFFYKYWEMKKWSTVTDGVQVEKGRRIHIDQDGNIIHVTPKPKEDDPIRE